MSATGEPLHGAQIRVAMAISGLMTAHQISKSSAAANDVGQVMRHFDRLRRFAGCLHHVSIPTHRARQLYL